MAILKDNLIKQFAELNKPKEESKRITLNAKYKKINGIDYVRIDGSEVYTPVTKIITAEDNDVVKVEIENHRAVMIGNVTNPAPNWKEFSNLNTKVDDNGNSISLLRTTVQGYDSSIQAINTNLESYNTRITTNEANINANASTLSLVRSKVLTNETNINLIESRIATNESDILINKANIDVANSNINLQESRIATNESWIGTNKTIIESNNTWIELNGATVVAAASSIAVQNSKIEILNSGFEIVNDVITGLSEIVVDNLVTNQLDTKFAKIDFANITKAAVEKLFVDSGIIKDLVVQNGKITGELVGVTIKGDLIEAGTLKADRLVILGSDGIYYKLNTDALGSSVTQADQELYQNGLHGNTLISKSVLAEKVNINDLVAFNADIGGIHITDTSLYSGLKDSIDNVEPGFNLNNAGEISIGNSNNYIKFYKERADWKLKIKSSELETDINNAVINASGVIQTNLSRSSGINLLRNSVLISWVNNSPKSWIVEGDVSNIFSAPSVLPAYFGALSKRIFHLNGTKIKQQVLVQPETEYTLSLYVKKEVLGSFIIKIIDENSQTVLKDDSTNAYDYKMIHKTFTTISSSIIVEIYSESGDKCIFSDLMLVPREFAVSWTQASDEILTANVLMDTDGLRVKSAENIGDYTIMSPYEFSAYHRNQNGTMKRVLNINKDLTELAKVEAKEEFIMDPMKIYAIRHEAVYGWAFVGNNLYNEEYYGGGVG